MSARRGPAFRTVDPSALADDPRPERTVARDLVRHGLMLGPVLVLVSGAIWGLEGAVSSGYAVAIVLVNFLLAAALITWAAPISLPLLMGAVLGGYLLRLGLIFVAVFLIRDASWFEKLPLGLTIIVTHLVLLVWELRYVSASLAYPGLKPSPTAPSP